MLSAVLCSSSHKSCKIFFRFSSVCNAHSHLKKFHPAPTDWLTDVKWLFLLLNAIPHTASVYYEKNKCSYIQHNIFYFHYKHIFAVLTDVCDALFFALEHHHYTTSCVSSFHSFLHLLPTLFAFLFNQPRFPQKIFCNKTWK